MEKKETKEIILGGHKAEITLANPKDKVVEQKRADKLNAMRITLTYIESQGMVKVSPEKTIKIAEVYLKWLEK